LFEFLYPAFTPLHARIAEAYYDTPDVTTPLLKFWAELVDNKQQRLNFDCCSANGILLFRESSALLKTFGALLFNAPQPAVQDIYAQRYKGIWLAMTILTRGLTGNYVNFGVFALYNDPALANALEVGVQLLLAAPLSDMLAFPKLQKAFYALAEALCENHFPATLAHLNPERFAHLLVALKEGVRSTDYKICATSCTALDTLAAYYFHNARKGADIMQHLQTEAQRELVPLILRELFEAVFLEEAPNQWALSRAIYSVSLVCPQAFAQVKVEFAQRAVDHQQDVMEGFDKLTEDVVPNLESRNRDKFMSNLTQLRSDIRGWIL